MTFLAMHMAPTKKLRVLKFLKIRNAPSGNSQLNRAQGLLKERDSSFKNQIKMKCKAKISKNDDLKQYSRI